MTPTVFIQFVQKFLAVPAVTLFFHLRPLYAPHVPFEERYTIERTGIENCFRCTIRHGYMDEVVTDHLATLIYDQLHAFIIKDAASAAQVNDAKELDTNSERQAESSATSTSTPDSLVASRLAALQKAYDTQVVYIVGKEQMRISQKTRLWRRVLLALFLWLRENTRSKMANLNIPVEKLVEVGFVKEV